jgi:hypothetical protein
MPLSIAFRWKTPRVETPKSKFELGGWGQAMSDVADSIKYARESRYRKAEQDRRNRIEDEDRQRRIDWEDTQRKAYGDAAGMMRGAAQERAALVEQRNRIQQQIDAIRAQLGG